MEKDSIIEEAVKIIRRYLSDDYKIFLFGSWAKGDALETSDIDIGILGEGKTPDDLMFRILREVETIPTLRKIDVVDFNLVEENFKNSALEHAKSL